MCPVVLYDRFRALVRLRVLVRFVARRRVLVLRLVPLFLRAVFVRERDVVLLRRDVVLLRREEALFDRVEERRAPLLLRAEDDLREDDFFRRDCPDSDIAIAIACLRLFTFLPEPPLLRSPSLYSCITLRTFPR